MLQVFGRLHFVVLSESDCYYLTPQLTSKKFFIGHLKYFNSNSKIFDKNKSSRIHWTIHIFYFFNYNNHNYQRGNNVENKSNVFKRFMIWYRSPCLSQLLYCTTGDNLKVENDETWFLMGSILEFWSWIEINN